MREALSAITGWQYLVVGGQVQGPSAIPVYRLQGKARGFAQARLDLCEQILDERSEPLPVTSAAYETPQVCKLPPKVPPNDRRKWSQAPVLSLR